MHQKPFHFPNFQRTQVLLYPVDHQLLLGCLSLVNPASDSHCFGQSANVGEESLSYQSPHLVSQSTQGYYSWISQTQRFIQQGLFSLSCSAGWEVQGQGADSVSLVSALLLACRHGFSLWPHKEKVISLLSKPAHPHHEGPTLIVSSNATSQRHHALMPSY